MRGIKRGSTDVPTWIGWDAMFDYYRKCPTDEYKKLFCTLFESGGRVSEVARLRPRQFSWNDECVVMNKMDVFKYRQRKKRDVYILRDELNPLAGDLIDFVEDCDTDFLFPRRMPLTSEVV